MWEDMEKGKNENESIFGWCEALCVFLSLLKGNSFEDTGDVKSMTNASELVLDVPV